MDTLNRFDQNEATEELSQFDRRPPISGDSSKIVLAELLQKNNSSKLIKKLHKQRRRAKLIKPLRMLFRNIWSLQPVLGLVKKPATRPEGISAIVRVKDEEDWIVPSLLSIRELADEIVVVDNGSVDNTIPLLEGLIEKERLNIRIFRYPKAGIVDLTNRAISKTTFKWIIKWDADIVAHTSGENDIVNLRRKILSLDKRRYCVIFLNLVELSGDLNHQFPGNEIHVEGYIYTYSNEARYVRQRWGHEALKTPRYYKLVYDDRIYAFHINVKNKYKMLNRLYWIDWMALGDFTRYPVLEDYALRQIKIDWETDDLETAANRYLKAYCKKLAKYDYRKFGDYPLLLNEIINQSKYKIEYRNNEIIGRNDLNRK